MPPDGQRTVQPLGPGFDFKSDQGRGLLDARALWAAQVGPQRLAMARTASVVVTAADSVKITKNLGASDAYVFVGVSLPATSPAPFISMWLSREEALGDNSSAPFLITTQMGAHGGVGVIGGFTQLLQPGEDLYAQLVTGGPVRQRVVVAAVVF